MEHANDNSLSYGGIVRRRMGLCGRSISCTHDDRYKDIPIPDIYRMVAEGAWNELLMRCLALPLEESRKEVDWIDPCGRSCLHVLCALDQYPDEVFYTLIKIGSSKSHAADMYGFTPLHHLALNTPDREALVKTLIDSCPGALKNQTVFGCTPLKIAMDSGSPENILSLILHHDPSSCSVVNKFGYTPLHVFFNRPNYRNDCNANFLRMLIGTNPEQIRTVDNTGMIPLHWLCSSNYVHTDHLYTMLEADPMTVFIRRQHDKAPSTKMLKWLESDEAQYFLEEDATDCFDVRNRAAFDYFQQMSLLIGTMYYRKISKRLLDERSWHLLHATVACWRFVPFEFIELVVVSNDAHVQETDDEGRTPLHVLLSSTIGDNAVECNDDVSACRGHIINLLLATSPELCVVKDNAGFTPLICGIRNRLRWEDGLDSVCKSFPEVLNEKDPVDNVYPFMAAAIHGNEQSVDTIYHLLRNSPCHIE